MDFRLIPAAFASRTSPNSRGSSRRLYANRVGRRRTDATSISVSARFPVWKAFEWLTYSDCWLRPMTPPIT